LNKIVSTNINAVFLAVILIAGTIAAFTPSFIIGVNAQSDPYYRDNSYGSEQEYPPEYADSNSYNSYEPEYGIDNYKKSYSNDNYEQPEYPSYKPDYKPEYPLDNNYKSKKESSSSVSLNKLNCINNNVNINGNNTGDINVGNSGKSATGSGTDEGYLGIGSLGGNGEGYDNGYKKQKDQGFTCIINNNNNNTIVTVNETTPEVPLTCEECFEASGLLGIIETNLNTLGTFGITLDSEDITIPEEVNTVEQLCTLLEGRSTPISEGLAESLIKFILGSANQAPQSTIDALVACLLEAGVIVETTVVEPFASDINTNNLQISQVKGDTSELTALEKQPDDSAELTATEKTTKLKQ
jgi:hypothetical protein